MGLFDSFTSFFTGGLSDVVQAGLDIGGGQLDAAQERQIQRANADLQREFAKNSIQWRVEDANKAGIHPLYALGAQPYTATPFYAGSNEVGQSLSKAGQSIGSAITKFQNKPVQTKMVELQIKEAEQKIRTDAAQGMYYQALADKTRQEMEASKDGGSLPSTVNDLKQGLPYIDIEDLSFQPLQKKDFSKLRGLIERVPNKIPTASEGDEGIAAGSKPSFQDYTLPGSGIHMVAPWSEEGFQESIGDSVLMLPGTVAQNIQTFGVMWLADVIAFYTMGKKPPVVYPSATSSQDTLRYFRQVQEQRYKDSGLPLSLLYTQLDKLRKKIQGRR